MLKIAKNFSYYGSYEMKVINKLDTLFGGLIQTKCLVLVYSAMKVIAQETDTVIFVIINMRIKHSFSEDNNSIVVR